jgi:ABC-type multidrug transport system ATPase subunit
MQILTLEQVGFSFGSVELFDNLSLSLDAGEIFAVEGPNGVGKTSLLRLIIGYYPLQKGKILVAQQDIQNTTKKVLSSIYAYVPQDLETYPGVLARQFFENINHEQANRYIVDFELAKLLDRTFSSLSGGERQKVLLAAALAREPKLVIADELTKGLDAQTSKFLGDYLKNYCRDMSAAAIVVSHDSAWVKVFCGRSLVLEKN